MTVGYYQHGVPSTVAAFLGGDDVTGSLRRIARASGVSVRVTAHPWLRGGDRRVPAAAVRTAVCGTRPPVHP